MIRNLKTLGLALVAVFAFGALAASVASAQQGTLTSTGPVTLTGEDTEPTVINKNALTQGALGRVECPHSKYTGHAVLTHAQTTAGSKHGLISVPATTATITPHYNTKCHAIIPILGTRPATVTMNGCDYVAHIGQTTGGANTYGVTFDLVCPPGKVIEVHVYKTGSVTHPDADAVCTFKIGSEHGGKPVNQGLVGAHLTHTLPPADDIDLSGEILGIHDTHEGTLCGSGTSNTNKLDIDVTIKGHNNLGANTDVTVTDS
ncbi:MAG: hypothetical protein WA687_01890 [Solirubrobacterales bacterium]